MRNWWRRSAPALALWLVLWAFICLAFLLPAEMRSLCGPWGMCG